MPSNSDSKVDMKKVESIYEFTVEDANGNTMNLDYYKGNVCFIVNVTTRDRNSLKCFRALEKIYKKYHKEKNGMILSLIQICFELK